MIRPDIQYHCPLCLGVFSDRVSFDRHVEECVKSHIDDPRILCASVFRNESDGYVELLYPERILAGYVYCRCVRWGFFDDSCEVTIGPKGYPLDDIRGMDRVARDDALDEFIEASSDMDDRFNNLNEGGSKP